VPNVFEKLSQVPGYAGYSDRDKRRQSDLSIRRAVGERVSHCRLRLGRLMSEAERSLRYDALDPLSSVKRRLDELADALRQAPTGYGILFDARVVGSADLVRITERDGVLLEAADELSKLVDDLSVTFAEAILDAERGLTALEEAITRRDEVLRSVE
jgi:hypothetical protein